MNNPLVSVIVPCYNQAQYLDECIKSVWDQTYQNWECIIVNDGSPDNTEETALKWEKKDKRFKYVRQENLGVSAARNNGIKHSAGTYIQFLDGDDILQQEKINYQVALLEKNDKIDIIYGGSKYFFDGESEKLYAIHPINIIPTVDMQFTDNSQLDVLLLRNVSTICATLYRRKVFENIRFKDTVFEDYLLHIDLAYNNFKFHFEKSEKGNCLIRITNNSQFMRHVEDKKNNHIFSNAVKNIKLKHTTKFSEYASRVRNNSLKNKTSEKDFKYIFYNITPPLLIKIFKIFFKKRT